ncbi:hypothetical protein K438DRAFT_1783169 [Mycena galopus ATCC 62051]|nr:hypothetical protein K438DRAFT_1783169 [Mycena galopus ATCC 62051]
MGNNGVHLSMGQIPELRIAEPSRCRKRDRYIAADYILFTRPIEIGRRLPLLGPGDFATKCRQVPPMAAMWRQFNRVVHDNGPRPGQSIMQFNSHLSVHLRGVDSCGSGGSYERQFGGSEASKWRHLRLVGGTLAAIWRTAAAVISVTWRQCDSVDCLKYGPEGGSTRFSLEIEIWKIVICKDIVVPPACCHPVGPFESESWWEFCYTNKVI